ncbi:MAG: hypothetical protein ACP5GH_07300, partial [Nitrososphaeria archaeon]
MTITVGHVIAYLAERELFGGDGGEGRSGSGDRAMGSAERERQKGREEGLAPGESSPEKAPTRIGGDRS